MKSILAASLVLGSLNQAGCGSMARSSISQTQISNKPVLRELNRSLTNTCEVNTETSYQIINREANPRQRFNAGLSIRDIAEISIPINQINNCVRNIIRGAEVKLISTNQEKIEFILGENTDLNVDLISIYNVLEHRDLSDHIECTTADFSSYFVKGIVCNHYDLNPLEKTTVSNTFQRQGYNVNLNDEQLIATKQ